MGRLIKCQRVFKAYRLAVGREGFPEIREVMAPSRAMGDIREYHMADGARDPGDEPPGVRVFDPEEKEGYVSERLDRLFPDRPTDEQVDGFILGLYPELTLRESMGISRARLRLLILESQLNGARARTEKEQGKGGERNGDEEDD